MTQENTPPAATNNKAKFVTLLALLAFVALVFVLTILKFAKVW